jgi:8-oxo-dGTP pyrophosphatase MutT (NUDIX family)
MSDWQTLSSEEVYKTPWIRVRRDEVKTHTGKQLTYSVVELNHPSVFIVATNAKGEIYMLKNYRYTTGQTMWEMPAGHSDGQDPLAAAKRELMEEAGLESDDWASLGTLYQAAGIGNLPFIAFLARNARPAAGERDKEEQISEGQFLSLETIETMAKTGEFNESAHLANLYLAKLHGL